MPPLTPLIRRLSSAQAVPSKDDLAKQKSKAEPSHKGSRNYSRCTSGGRPPPPESVSLPDDLPIPDAAPPQSSGSRVDLQAFTAIILAALSPQLDGLSSSVDAIKLDLATLQSGVTVLSTERQDRCSRSLPQQPHAACGWPP